MLTAVEQKAGSIVKKNSVLPIKSSAHRQFCASKSASSSSTKQIVNVGLKNSNSFLIEASKGNYIVEIKKIKHSFSKP